MRGFVICDGEVPEDGEFHRLGYVESVTHKCKHCGFCAQWKLRGRNEASSVYLCGKHYVPLAERRVV